MENIKVDITGNKVFAAYSPETEGQSLSEVLVDESLLPFDTSKEYFINSENEIVVKQPEHDPYLVDSEGNYLGQFENTEDYTEIPTPPPGQPKQKYFWYGDSWIEKEDNRGSWYNKVSKEKVDVVEFGPVSFDYTQIPPKENSIWDESIGDWVVSSELVARSVRSKRNRMVENTVWIKERHESQKALGITPTLTDAEYEQWLQYWQDLRDITEQEGFPDNMTWPKEPTVK